MCRSSRLATRPAERGLRVADAVLGSLESAARICNQKLQCQLTVQQLHQAVPEPTSGGDANRDVDKINLARDTSQINTCFPATNTPTSQYEYEVDPLTWAKACASPFADDWCWSIQEELNSLKGMRVYELVSRSSVPQGQKIHTGKPVFHVKRDADGTVT